MASRAGAQQRLGRVALGDDALRHFEGSTLLPPHARRRPRGDRRPTAAPGLADAGSRRACFRASQLFLDGAKLIDMTLRPLFGAFATATEPVNRKLATRVGVTATYPGRGPAAQSHPGHRIRDRPGAQGQRDQPEQLSQGIDSLRLRLPGPHLLHAGRRTEGDQTLEAAHVGSRRTGG